MTYPKIFTSKEFKMSEEKKVEFKAGFEHNKSGETLNMKYKDESVFTENAPISQKDMKAFAQYQCGYSKSFLDVSVEEAHKAMKKDGAIKTVVTEAPFGPNKSDNIQVMLKKDVERTIIDFQGVNPPKKITTCSIAVKVKTGANLGTTAIKNAKQELHKELYGDN